MPHYISSAAKPSSRITPTVVTSPSNTLKNSRMVKLKMLTTFYREVLLVDVQ